ncbi:hypothetical protein [Halomontanus rarus]|uniref:hypothetical protein n=1 Tax=Halomontanus rarus TaxID=3034020 RepID=UPI001A98D1F8
MTINYKDLAVPAGVVGAAFLIGAVFSLLTVPKPVHYSCGPETDLYELSNITDVYGAKYPDPLLTGMLREVSDYPIKERGSIVRLRNGTLKQFKDTRIYAAEQCDKIGFYQQAEFTNESGDAE